MRFSRAVAYFAVAMVAAVLNSSAADAYSVAYKFPPITPEMQAKIDKAANPIFSDLTYGLGGKALVLPNVDGGVLIVENGKGREIPPPPGAEQVGRAGTISADGQRMYYFKPKSAAATVKGGTIFAIDLATGASKMICPIDWQPRSAILSPDGTRLADDMSISRPLKLNVLDLTTGKPIASEMAARSDTQALAFRSYFERANMWALGWNKSSSALYVLRNEDGAEVSSTRKDNATTLVTKTLGPPSEFGAWSVGQPGFSHITSFAGHSWPNATAISPTGEVVYMNEKTDVYVASGEKSRKAGKLGSVVMRPLVSPSGKYLLVTSTSPKGETGFTVLDLTTGKSFSELTDPAKLSIQPGAWHPSEDKFLAGYSDAKGNVEIREYRAAELGF